MRRLSVETLTMRVDQPPAFFPKNVFIRVRRVGIGAACPAKGADEKPFAKRILSLLFSISAMLCVFDP